MHVGLIYSFDVLRDTKNALIFFENGTNVNELGHKKCKGFVINMWTRNI